MGKVRRVAPYEPSTLHTLLSIDASSAVAYPCDGMPEDIAAMVAFLFSDDGAHMNGQTLLVDGGANVT
jgi:NAD(P)-dependent dehydrogenase (short-subunit alcohol dehydrogenase family)